MVDQAEPLTQAELEQYINKHVAVALFLNFGYMGDGGGNIIGSLKVDEARGNLAQSFSTPEHIASLQKNSDGIREWIDRQYRALGNLYKQIRDPMAQNKLEEANRLFSTREKLSHDPAKRAARQKLLDSYADFRQKGGGLGRS